MNDAFGMSIIDRRLRALKLLNESVAGRKALIHGDEVTLGRQYRRTRDREDAERSGHFGPFGGVHSDKPDRVAA
jgi:hypothetical protein